MDPHSDQDLCRHVFEECFCGYVNTQGFYRGIMKTGLGSVQGDSVFAICICLKVHFLILAQISTKDIQYLFDIFFK